MDTCLTYDELVNKLESLQQENQILQKKLKQNAESNSVLVHESLTEPEFAEVKYHEEILTALRQSDERYQNLIEYAPFPLIIAKNGFIEFVNNSAYILLGAKNQSDLIGKSVFQFIHPESKSALLKNIHLTLRENHFSLPEEKIVRLDGETRLVELNAVQYHEKNGTSLHIYLKDITDTKKSEKYKEALIEIEKIIHNSLNQQEIIEKTMHRAAAVTECDSAAVSFYQDKKWVVKYVHGFEDSVIGLTLKENQEPHALLAIKTKAPVIVDDASSDSRVNKEWLKQWGITSVLVVPLFTRYKKIGVIFFNYYRHKNISAEKIKFLGSLSSSLSLALENSALYENVLKELAIRKQKESELDKANLSLKALSKSSQAMVYAQDELTYAKQVCNIVVEDFGYSMVSINYLEKDSSRTVRPFAWSGLDDTYVKNLKLSWGDGPEGQGPTGKAVRSRKPVVCNNIFKDPSYELWLDEGRKRGYQSCIAIPLISERHVFGTLNIYSADLDSFNARQIKFLSELAKDLSYGVSTIRLREAGKLTLKALTESEEKFRMLTEKSNALICELDLEGRILYANSKFSEHLGYDPKELEGHPISENCMPEMQQNFFDSIVHFFPNPAFKNEWYLKDKKGLWHWFRCHTSAFVNAKGEERRSVILFEISDIKQVEEQLKRYTRELKELNATKDKFFGIIAHDLKNPFTSLLGASELLINSLENFDHGTVKHIGMLLYDSAKRGYTLLQNLLEWSRSQSGTITYNPKPISLKQVVLENISSIQISAFNKKQQITCDISKEIIITADQNMLNTILRNLLQNAIKFTNDGGKIVLKAQKVDNDIIIGVKDSGIGIAEENVKKLFRLDEKFTNPGTRNEQGTGLGLILCKEFVEKHKGRIWVESKVGKGSKFSFTIPQSL